MASRSNANDSLAASQELLGYLNFSSGASDPQFLRNLNQLCGSLAPHLAPRQSLLDPLDDLLRTRLTTLTDSSPAFQNADQARAVLRLTLEDLPARYREFHRDLLFHQSDADLWRPLLLGRMFEAVLEQGGPWDESERITKGAIQHLNDYIGYRPVAVLQTAQRIEPYAHEWIRPIPLYVRGAGVGCGKYESLVTRALDVLRATDPSILREAFFDPDLLDELAVDPRAYDFDHPVNKRPNYHFGQWDPHLLDN